MQQSQQPRHLGQPASKARRTVGDSKETLRRLAAIERRLDWIDQNDTRGVPGLRLQLSEQAKDITQNTAALEVIKGKIDNIAAQRRQQYVSVGLALLPVYILLFLTVFHIAPGG